MSTRGGVASGDSPWAERASRRVTDCRGRGAGAGAAGAVDWARMTVLVASVDKTDRWIRPEVHDEKPDRRSRVALEPRSQYHRFPTPVTELKLTSK